MFFLSQKSPTLGIDTPYFSPYILAIKKIHFTADALLQSKLPK
jgi:hypothetical protein